MTIFCIQVQPDRAPGIDIDRVRDLCKRIAADNTMAERHGAIEGNDEGPYLNFMFEVPDAQKFWAAFDTIVYSDLKVGDAMKKASMATCSGEQGWDDYSLLYHYDKSFPLDSLNAH